MVSETASEAVLRSPFQFGDLESVGQHLCDGGMRVTDVKSDI